MTLQFYLIIIVFSFVLINELEAFQISSSSSSSTCAVTDKENTATRINCPSDSIISNIHFASYGNPEGTCGNYTVGSCHATYSMNIVMNECLNNNKCSIIPSNDVFDLPAVDACHDLVTKLLFFEVSCKANSSNNVSVSSQITDVLPITSSMTTTSSVCMIGWVFYNDKCYHLNIASGVIWTRCESICSIFGASMLCIPDSTTNAWIANQLNQLSSSYTFIGYSDLQNPDGTYNWISGCSSTYTNWGSYNNYNGYASMYKYDGKWYSYGDNYVSSTSCSCEYSMSPTASPTVYQTIPTTYPSTVPSTAVPSTISPTVGCQVGWSYYNANCYKFDVGSYFSWSGCKSECTSLGASMLCIHDSTTNTWIANQISQLGYYYSWIGYSDLPNNDGKYEWVSGCSSSYSNSAYGYNYYYNDCVYIYAYNGAWDSSNDSGSSLIACSCEYPIAPTSLPTLSPTSPTIIPTPIQTFEPSSAPSTITPSVGCQVGWSYYDNNCYNFNVGAYFSWSGCLSVCTSLGASMLCIPDSTTNSWIANQISLNGYSYSWIGYSDLPNNDGKYEWVSGCSSSYSNSAYGYNYYYNDCVYLQTNNRVWYSSSDSGSSSIACSCEYSIAPTSLPTLSPTSPTVYPTTTEPSSSPSTITPSVGCQVGWSYYNYNCYKFNVGTGYSWSGCKSQCASLGASMLCIPDSTTNNWIANQISQLGYYYSWIGYSDLPNNDGNYEWVSGCSSSYSKSAYGNNYYYYDCVYIEAYYGYWYGSYCDYYYYSCSCEYPIVPTSLPTLSPTSPTVNPSLIPTTIPSSSPPTIIPTVGCHVGWSYYDSNCYKFNVGSYFSWSGCKSQCASLGASMLCIPDSTTNTWIANQISLNGYYYSWIGYSDLPNNDGKYEWVSGCSSSYTKYINNNYYYYDCVYIYAYSGAWYGYYCDYGYSYSMSCSCQYSIAPTSLPTLSPTSLPTLAPTSSPTIYPTSSPSPSTRSDYANASAIIGIVVGCVVFAIIVILILVYFFCRRTNQVCISTINESPSNNDNISSSDQAYTDIPPTCPYPTSDDDDIDGVVPISSSTIELQVIVASDAYYNDVVPMDHEQELLPVAVQV